MNIEDIVIVITGIVAGYYAMNYFLRNGEIV